MPQTFEFNVGDLCTCLYNGTAYDAKIQDIKNPEGPKPVYVVHFMGWNSRYDEQVPVDQSLGRLFTGCATDHVKKYGGKLDSKIKRPLTSDQQQQVDSEADARPSEPSTSAKKSKKSAFQSSSNAADFQIEFPKTLRKVLVDDMAMVHQNFYVRLPATYTIDRIITDYIKTIPITNEHISNTEDLLIEYEDHNTRVTNVALICTARALSDYFNVVLGYQLLYKFERTQYNDLIQSEAAALGIRRGNIATLPDHGFRASAHYGVVHLLRMIARMPELLKLTEWNDHLINRIQLGIHDFLVYLNKNINVYFTEGEDYQAADADYFRRASAAEDVAGPSQ